MNVLMTMVKGSTPNLIRLSVMYWEAPAKTNMLMAVASMTERPVVLASNPNVSATGK